MAEKTWKRISVDRSWECFPDGRSDRVKPGAELALHTPLVLFTRGVNPTSTSTSTSVSTSTSTHLWPILRCPWRGTRTWRRPASPGGSPHWCLRIQRCAGECQNSRASFRTPPAGSCCGRQRDLHTGSDRLGPSQEKKSSGHMMRNSFTFPIRTTATCSV